MDIAHLAEKTPEAVEQLVDVVFSVRQEIGQFELLRIVPLEPGQYDLKCTLKQLHFSLDEQVIADLDMAGLGFADIPQASADGAGALAQLDLQVSITVAVRPPLLVRDQVNFLDRLAVGQLLDETSAHEFLDAWVNQLHRGGTEHTPSWHGTSRKRFLAIQR